MAAAALIPPLALAMSLLVILFGGISLIDDCVYFIRTGEWVPRYRLSDLRELYVEGLPWPWNRRWLN
jgi:hypothetical protein